MCAKNMDNGVYVENADNKTRRVVAVCTCVVCNDVRYPLIETGDSPRVASSLLDATRRRVMQIQERA